MDLRVTPTGPGHRYAGLPREHTVGAVTYDLFHHKGIALVLLLLGLYYGHLYKDLSGLPFDYGHLFTAAIILFGHASMDRMFGYGLKFGDHFQHTHLGWIGKGKSGE